MVEIWPIKHYLIEHDNLLKITHHNSPEPAFETNLVVFLQVCFPCLPFYSPFPSMEISHSPFLQFGKRILKSFLNGYFYLTFASILVCV